jgi:hypothetical protein
MFTTDGGRCRVARIKTVGCGCHGGVLYVCFSLKKKFTGVLSGKSN